MSGRLHISSEMAQLAPRQARGGRRWAVTGGVLVAVVVVVLLPPAAAFNVDEYDPIQLEPLAGQTGLHFGFSLAHYMKGGERRLLVGAPRANTTSQTGVLRPGVLFDCQLDGGGQCQEMFVNQENDNIYNIWADDKRDEQGLGFSIASDGQTIVVCAPRWHAFSEIFNHKRDLPAGVCFAGKPPSYEFKAFSPPFDGQTAQSMHYQTTGSCQFGMSAAHVKGQNTFALGAPGCWNWQGDTWEVGLNAEVKVNFTRRVERLSFQGISAPASNLYFGYSVASIKFGDHNAIVSSMPRTISINALTNDPREKDTTLGPSIYILIQDSNNLNKLEVHQTISPPTDNGNSNKFAFFGYSLATLDLNGDGLEDLVVGAPLYHNSTHLDQGAIFVYMQTTYQISGGNKIGYEMAEEEMAPQRMGSHSYGRFGSCVASVGDLNGDGYQDLAVGAPYFSRSSDNVEVGAVYIYMGSQNGLEKDPRQIMTASSKYRGFGSSIAQRLPDTWGTGYDVAVGVHNVDAVLVFRSKEVLDLSWNLTFSGPIDLTKNECGCSYGSCPCVTASICFLFKKKVSKGTNNKKPGFGYSLSTESDTIFFEYERNVIFGNVEISEDVKHCEEHKIMAKTGIEKFNPFIINGEVSSSSDEEVVIDYRSVLSKEEKLNVYVHCATSVISGCQSDIILSYDILSNYTLEDSSPMAISSQVMINFKVKNRGETAYNTELIISHFGELNIMSYPDNFTCNEKREIECIIGPNFQNNSEVTFTLGLTPKEEFFNSLDTHAAYFNITAEVRTSSTLTNPGTAVKNIQVPIAVTGSLDLTKQPSSPTVVYYNSSSYYKLPEEATDEEELGPEILHEYRILNKNSYSIYSTEITIEWPLKINGKYFLYLLENPMFQGLTPSCTYANGKVNPHNLKISVSEKNQEEIAVKYGVSAARTSQSSETSDDYMTLQCTFGKMISNKELSVVLRSRLVLKTLVELDVGNAIGNASSIAKVKVTKMPLDASPPPSLVSSVTTAISYQKYSIVTTIPVWVYVVSALGGLLVLAIIILIMWQCGFFKRKRLENADNANQGGEGGALTEAPNGQEEEEDNPVTPNSPMLKATESAEGDFEFSKP